MSSSRALCRTAVLFVAVLGLSACVGASQTLRDGAAEHVYSQPLAELWPQVEAYMTEQGYSFQRSPGKHVLRTEWRETGTSGATRTLVAYLVEGVPHASGGSILRVSRGIKPDPNNVQGNPQAMYVPGSSPGDTRAILAENEMTKQVQRPLYAPARDVDMELALMRRLDPAAVTKLEGKEASASR
jgi:hypothetical protein